MQREDKIILTLSTDELKKILSDSIVAKYPALEGKKIVVDTQNVLQPITALEIHIETAEATTVAL